QVGVGQVRLHGQHAHGPDVLDDKHSQRYPARQGVELELVVEELDHHQGAGEAHAGREVDERKVAAGVAYADRVEETEAEGDADWDLQHAGHHHRRPRCGELLQVDLQPDDE